MNFPINIFKLIFSLSILIFLQACENLVGPVQNTEIPKIKTEILWETDINSGIHLNKIWENEYTEDGKIVSHINYGSNGTLKDKSTYKYESNKSIENKKSFSLDGKILLEEKIDYVYSDGRVVKKLVLDLEGKTKSSTEFKYDAKGNLIETKECIGTNCKTISTYNYTFDKDGAIVYRETISHIGGIVSKDSLLYDHKKNYIEVININVDNTVKISYSYYYSKYGFIDKEIHKDSNGNIIKAFVYERKYY